MKSDSTPFHLCFEVLGNPLRIKAIQSLRKSPKSVGQLVKETGEEQSKVSHSLAALRKCQFIEGKRQGKKMVYSLRKQFLNKIEECDIFTALEKHYADHGCKCWKCEC
ncbi:MAG: winged helix-turn-helix transcriptional regulator [Candidatus Diapherotrites archaeon]|uniref:Winged helix-turn-helix transcriptional regulator n=1 Tax=Candidatus Iainarchaeum sp. TaxID=3101447 RepID=A0A938YR15_9ARCH|nr:winged helix-turn-helix transcriptional regulator [Candidatus Diapherotrites archaeon]